MGKCICIGGQLGEEMDGCEWMVGVDVWVIERIMQA